MAILTAADYVARMKQAIGNADPSTGFSLFDVLNEAVRALFDWSDWQWRSRPPAFCDLVAAQEYVALPADFGSNGIFLSVSGQWSPFVQVSKTTLEDLAMRKGLPVQTHLHYWVAVSDPSQSSSSVRPAVPRLEIWPTPQASQSQAFRITYKAGAIELASNTDVPNIPAGYETALTHLARFYIDKYELGADSPDAASEYAAATAILGQQLPLREMDGLQDGDMGVITNGAASKFYGRRVNPWMLPFGPVSTR